MTRQERDLAEALKKPRIYFIPASRATDLEPSSGYYVGPLTDDDRPHGPFADEDRAEEWREEAMKGLALDRLCA
ncbi:hypothetical protein [Azospirillum rugosum]|uniref:Uncharacterized protein n=1 Tax=Azospirillum rugosum TaxID=416170 RepID=A0ABS4SE25_9PROT|nr:hypothetical protein [Azospirillum rugosum]MBP2290757.1 hypothetical protein [Azospirillum rugosum]MDQ0525646.1 hypothetical protein [Azospirillum rugosum]